MLNLNIPEDILEKSVTTSNGFRNCYRYSLTNERDKHFLSIEMPRDMVFQDFGLSDAEGAPRVDISFLPSDKSESVGLEKGRYLILRKGDSTGVVLTKRGEKTRAARVALFSIPEEDLPAIRKNITRDLKPIETMIGDSKALVFRMPDFTLQAED